MKPTIQLFLLQVPAAVHTSPVVGIPRASQKVRFAPLEPSTCQLTVVQLVVCNSTGLIPALNSSGDGIEHNSVVKGKGLLPTAGVFFTQGLAFSLVEPLNSVNTARILSNKGSFLEKRKNIDQTILVRIVLHVLEELLTRDAHQRVFDPVIFRCYPTGFEDNAVTYSPVLFSVSSATLCLRRPTSAKIDARLAGSGLPAALQLNCQHRGDEFWIRD
jgi:hypothetical protein